MLQRGADHQASATLPELAERNHPPNTPESGWGTASLAEARSADIEEAGRLYAAGWSLAKVGTHFSVDPATVNLARHHAGGRLVNRAFREAGVPLRGPHDWERRPRQGPPIKG